MHANVHTYMYAYLINMTYIYICLCIHIDTYIYIYISATVPSAQSGVTVSSHRVPWFPDQRDLEYSKGPGPGTTAEPLRIPAAPKFYLFLTSNLYRHFSDFGANLAPTWLPTWDQNRSQTSKKSIKKRIKMLINFSIDFSWLFEGFFVDLASKLEGPGPQQNT